jgi:hypothetical protein
MSRFWNRIAVVGSAVALLAILTSLFLRTDPGHIPQWVTIHGSMSNSEAQSLYKSGNEMLHAIHWGRMRADLAAGQFKLFLLDTRRGPERIHTLSKDHGWFVVTATNRLGQNCRIRSLDPVVCKPSFRWNRAQSSQVTTGVVISDIHD